MDDLRKYVKVPTFEVTSFAHTGLKFCKKCRVMVIDLHAHNMKYDDPAHVAASVLGA